MPTHAVHHSHIEFTDVGPIVRAGKGTKSRKKWSTIYQNREEDAVCTGVTDDAGRESVCAPVAARHHLANTRTTLNAVTANCVRKLRIGKLSFADCWCRLYLDVHSPCRGVAVGIAQHYA